MVHVGDSREIVTPLILRPHLQSSAAEEVDQTSAVCKKMKKEAGRGRRRAGDIGVRIGQAAAIDDVGKGHTAGGDDENDVGGEAAWGAIERRRAEEEDERWSAVSFFVIRSPFFFLFTKKLRRCLKTWVQVSTRKRTCRRFHVCGLLKNKRTANTNVCALSARRRHKRLEELFSEKQTTPKCID
ncbi:hypothetical protein LXL04_009084 [Taraxacum kok-saghyz]